MRSAQLVSLATAAGLVDHGGVVLHVHIVHVAVVGHYRLTRFVCWCCCCLYIVSSALQELGPLPLVSSGSPHRLLPDVLERLMDRHALCELGEFILLKRENGTVTSL